MNSLKEDITLSILRALPTFVLKVDYISDSTTNVGRALKMESVMSSFRLFMATSNGARQPQSVQGNLDLCKTTSICAKQPQFMQNNLNLCREKKTRQHHRRRHHYHHHHHHRHRH